MYTLTNDQLIQHRALILRLRRDGCPPEYIHAKSVILKEAWAQGLAVHWRAIWLLEFPNNDNWRGILNAQPNQ